MSSKRFWATLLVLFAAGPHYLGAWAQLSDMAACPTGWQWNQNSLGQDPCALSSALDAACRGVGSYTIPPLTSTQNYVPPQRSNSEDLTCDCDTVMYSLYMACSTCQGGVIYSWTQWISQCNTVYVTQYPHTIPYGAAIPHWAYYDVTTLPNKTYSDTVAISVGRDPEVSGKPLNTGTIRTSSRTGLPTSTGSPSNPTGTSSSSDDDGINLPLIIGASAGGVVLLIIAAILGVCIRRKRRGGGNKLQLLSPQPLPVQEVLDYQKVQPMSPMFSPTTASLPYNAPTSPGPQFNAPPGPNPQFNAPPGPDPQFYTQQGPNPQFNGPPSPNPPFPIPPGPSPPPFNSSYYNPEDPTTFPPPMGDGQSSVTFSNTSGPGPGRYGGMPEL